MIDSNRRPVSPKRKSVLQELISAAGETQDGRADQPGALALPSRSSKDIRERLLAEEQ
jgi:hypothetical protein